MPAYTSSHVTSTFRQICAVYTDFAKDYETLSRARCYAYLAESKRVVFETDCNLGLVQRALAALPARAIMDLQNVYRTIEVCEVVRLVFDEDQAREQKTLMPETTPPRFSAPEQAKAFVEGEVQRLVAQRKLSARIVASPTDPSSRYLEFLPTVSNSKDAAAALQRALQGVSESGWTLSNLDARITGSRDFLKKAYEGVTKSGVLPGGAPGHGPFGSDIQDFGNDEELMDMKVPGGFDD